MKIQQIQNTTSRTTFKNNNLEDWERRNLARLERTEKEQRNRVILPLAAATASALGAGGLFTTQDRFVYTNDDYDVIEQPALVELIPNSVDFNLKPRRDDIVVEKIKPNEYRIKTDKTDVFVEKSFKELAVNGKINGSEINARIRDNRFDSVELPVLLGLLSGFFLGLAKSNTKNSYISTPEKEELERLRRKQRGIDFQV